MIAPSPMLLAFAAYVLTACAVALGGPGGAHPNGVAGVAPALPFSCALVARPTGGGTTLEGRLTAREAISAAYALRVRGAGVAIDQGGDLSLAAGASALLGEASVSTPPGGLDARLTVTVAGRTYECPRQGA